MRSKISHLPRKLREQLNVRLDDGESADQILPWINELPAVKKILAAKFDSTPISKKNLYDWKDTGFRHWLSQQQILELARQIAGDTIEIDVASCSSGKSPTVANFIDSMAHRFAAQYMLAAEAVVTLMENRPADEKEPALRRICREMSALRRCDQNAERIAIERQRVELERERFAFEREQAQVTQVEEFVKWSKLPEIRESYFPGKKMTRADMDKLRVRLFGESAMQLEEDPIDPENDPWADDNEIQTPPIESTPDPEFQVSDSYA